MDEALSAPEPLERDEIAAAALLDAHPPALRHPNKIAVFEVACPPGTTWGGQLAYSRWARMRLPDRVDPQQAATLVSARPGFYDYLPALDAETSLEWHVNFADPRLFVAYGGPLFAQDEMQVAEHPALGALREALLAADRPTLTVEDGRATPVLVSGVERRCQVDTRPDAELRRPEGLYGNAFGRASADVVARATARIDPPTISNIVAMAAPAGGFGRYRTDEIEGILVTAFTGYRAALLESRRQCGPDVAVAVHTGYWGCGAFGGNRVLMALLQAVAAQLAGLDRLVFHAGSGSAPLEEALGLLASSRVSGGGASTGDFIGSVETMGFRWGAGDGN